LGRIKSTCGSPKKIGHLGGKKKTAEKPSRKDKKEREILMDPLKKKKYEECNKEKEE